MSTTAESAWRALMSAPPEQAGSPFQTWLKTDDPWRVTRAVSLYDRVSTLEPGSRQRWRAHLLSATLPAQPDLYTFALSGLYCRLLYADEISSCPPAALRTHLVYVRTWARLITRDPRQGKAKHFFSLCPMDLERALQDLQRWHTQTAQTPELLGGDHHEDAQAARRRLMTFGAVATGVTPWWAIWHRPLGWCALTLLAVALAWTQHPGWLLGALLSAPLWLWHHRRGGDLWLLLLPRLGAAIAVGAMLLILADEAWAIPGRSSTTRTLILSGSLLTAAGLYLYVDVAKQVRGAVRRLARAAQVFTSALSYGALLTSVICVGLGAFFVKPDWAPGAGMSVPAVGPGPDPIISWRVLVLFSSAAVALGVLLQLLWEDRSISDEV